MDKIGNGILNDYYGGMLTPHQQEILRLYFDCDLSLSEISEELGITRQGVRENIVRATDKLKMLECKLGLVSKVGRIADCLSAIIVETQSLDDSLREKLIGLLEEIKEI